MAESSISLTNETIKRLASCKQNPDETYDELINRLIDEADDDLTWEDEEEIAKGLDDIAKGKTVSQEQLFTKFGI